MTFDIVTQQEGSHYVLHGVSAWEYCAAVALFLGEKMQHVYSPFICNFPCLIFDDFPPSFESRCVMPFHFSQGTHLHLLIKLQHQGSFTFLLQGGVLTFKAALCHINNLHNNTAVAFDMQHRITTANVNKASMF